MAKQTILTSLMGRALGLNSSGHLVTPRDKVDQDLYPAADVGNINAGVATGATAENYGVTVLGAGDTASAASYEITAPAPGVKVELHIGCSASELTLGGTATSVIFKPAVGGVGSSMFLTKANLAGGVIALRGVTANQYNVIGSTAGMTIG